MEKWELARYLIDAKKRVDSMRFIEDHFNELKYVNIRELINNNLREFYIDCVIILDKVFSKAEKRDLKKSNETIQRIYYERDKNYAHKDLDYEKVSYDSLNKMNLDLIKKIETVHEICEDKLPKVLTLDFLSYDPLLFRLVNGINREKEFLILEKKYSNKIPESSQNVTNDSEYYTVFEDTEDFKNIKKEDVSSFVTVLSDGLTFEEGVQIRQDVFIRTNLLHDSDMWPTINKKVFRNVEKLMKLGIVDEYLIFHEEKMDAIMSDPILTNRLINTYNEMDSILEDAKKDEYEQ